VKFVCFPVSVFQRNLLVNHMKYKCCLLLVIDISDRPWFFFLARTDQVIVTFDWPWCFAARTDPKLLLIDVFDRPFFGNNRSRDCCIRSALVFFSENQSNDCSSFRRVFDRC
jgi:hypothetical protein